MSGTSYTIYNPEGPKKMGQNEDPTKYKLEKEPGIDPGTKPTPPYKSSSIPPIHPAVTQSRADKLKYSQRFALWRLAATTLSYGELAQFKAKQIEELQFSTYEAPYAKDPKNQAQVAAVAELHKRPIQVDNINTAIEALSKASVEKWTLGETIKALEAINPNLPGFLAIPMYAQFTRDEGDMEKALTSLSDISQYTGQWNDILGKFQIYEMIDILKSALFYNGLELQVDVNKGTSTLFKHQTNEATGNPETIALTMTEFDKHNNTVKFSLESNTIEAVVALADQISNNRQGNTNFIDLKTMGDDPALFLVLARTLISQHGMQVGLDNVRKEVDAAIGALNDSELTKEWNSIKADCKIHDYNDARKTRKYCEPHKAKDLISVVVKKTPPASPSQTGATATQQQGTTVNASTTPPAQTPKL